MKLKYKALLILIIPIGFILMFMIGELVDNDISGLGHLTQLIPLFLVIYLANKFPKVMGIIMMVTGLLLSVLYFSKVGFMYIPVHFILFLPIIISGYLLLKNQKG